MKLLIKEKREKMLNRLESEIHYCVVNIGKTNPKIVKDIFFNIRLLILDVITRILDIGVHETMGRGNPQPLILAIVGISVAIIGLEMATIIVFGITLNINNNIIILSVIPKNTVNALKEVRIAYI